MKKYEFGFGWASVAEMSYEDCIIDHVLIPVVVAKRSCDGVIIGWHEALTKPEIALCTKSTTLFNLDSVQEWTLDKTNCHYEKVESGLTAIPGDSLKGEAKLAKKQLANLLRLKPQGCLVDIIELVNKYGNLLPRKLVRKALSIIPAKSVESWDVLYFKPIELGDRIKGKKQHVYNSDSFIEWEDVETIENKKRYNISCKLPNIKWEPEAKSETHEGNSKSKAKWLRSGKEARKRANRNR